MDNTDVESQIVQALAKVEDAEQKATLLIMHDGFKQVREEIAALRGDVPGLREAVLNGHASMHHEHHEWIAEKMAEEAETNKSLRHIRDNLLEKAFIAIVSVLGTLLVIGLLFARDGIVSWRFWG